MKTYTIKNYKGNLVESLKKFQEKYPKAKIVEATENDNSLKIVAEDNEADFQRAAAEFEQKIGSLLKNIAIFIVDGHPQCVELEEILKNMLVEFGKVIPRYAEKIADVKNAFDKMDDLADNVD